MVLLLGTLLIFVALLLVFGAAGGLVRESRGVSRSLQVLEAMTNAPDELKAELDRPFAERILDPLFSRAQSLGKRITGADQAERIRRRLDMAGNPPGWTVDRVSAAKVVGAGAGFAALLLMALAIDVSIGIGIVMVAGGVALGFMGPNIWLYNIATKRDSLMQKSLADAIDLLTISVEAGLGFDAAVQQVARNTEGPLALEFSRVLQEMQIGRSRSEAMRALGDRTNLPDIRSFVSAMVQADSLGIPIAQVLRVQSGEIRTKRRQRAEEKAAQIPVKIMIPVVLFILPCLLLVVMGPGIIGIIDAFGG